MTLKTLQGLHVIVTRTRTQASVLRSELERRGATVLEVPAMELQDLDGWESQVFTDQPWDWTVITSKNAAERIARVIRMGKGRHEQLGRIAATGNATARYLEKYGLSPQLVPERYIAEALAEAMIARGVEGQRIVLPRAEDARAVLPDALRAAGADVHVVPIYRAEIPEGSLSILQASAGMKPDLVTFASSKTARHFAELLHESGVDEWFSLPAAAIGPVTAETASDLGFTVVAMPDQHTISSLVDAIEGWHTVH